MTLSTGWQALNRMTQGGIRRGEILLLGWNPNLSNIMNQNTITTPEDQLEWFRNFHNAVLSTVVNTQKTILERELFATIIQTDPEFKLFDRFESIKYDYIQLGSMFKVYFEQLFTITDWISDDDRKMITEAVNGFVSEKRTSFDINLKETSVEKLQLMKDLVEYLRTILHQLGNSYSSGNITHCWMNYASLQVVICK